MAKVETFPNAPIVEAILSIEVSSLTDFVASAESFHQVVRGAMPIREEIRTLSGVGYRFGSNDGLQVVQITRRSCSFHRLQPYTSWEHFSGEARAIWREYVIHFAPEQVLGASLRYLNRINLPTPFRGLHQYVSLVPNLPEGIDAGLSGFLLRLSLTDAAIPALAYVTQRTEYDPAAGVLPLLFDIDVRSVPETSIRDEMDVWRVMEELRDYKNRLFFSSITEAARELFR